MFDVFANILATAVEVILLGFVLYKAITLSSQKVLKNNTLIAGAMVHENVAYFVLYVYLLTYHRALLSDDVPG